MNKPTVFNKAEILYSSVMTDELNTNSTIAIVDFQNNDNQAVVNEGVSEVGFSKNRYLVIKELQIEKCRFWDF